MATKAIPFCLLLMCAISVYAQNNTVDSLQTVLQAQPEDTNKVKTYFELIKIVRLYDYSEALKLAGEQLQLSNKLNYHWGAGKAHNSMGLIHNTLSHPDAARLHYTLAAAKFEQIKDYSSLSGVYSNIAMIYSDQDKPDSCIYFSLLANGYNEQFKGDSLKKLSNKMFIFSNISTAYYYKHQYDSCMLYNDRTIKIAAVLNNNKVLADCYQQVALINLAMGQYPAALEYTKKALPLYEKEKIIHGIVQSKSGLGLIYHSMGNYKLSKKYAIESNELARQQKDSGNLAQNYLTLGLIELSSENYNVAIQYFEDGLEVCKNIDKPVMREQFLQYTGESWYQLKNYNKAVAFLSPAAEYFSDNKIKFKCYKIIAASYEKKQDYRQALSWYIKYHELERTIFDSTKFKTVNELLAKYESEKKAVQIKLLQKDNQLKTANALKERQTKNVAFAGTAAVLAIGFVSYHRYRQRKKTEAEQAMIKERLRISRELHDDVGSTLSGISMYSHIAQSQVESEQTSEVKKSLGVIQQSAGEMIHKLQDIVWLVNPKQDSLQKLIQRLEEYATDMATIKNMKVKVNVPAHIAEHGLPIESRRNIYLFCKEAINNAVKYSSGTTLELIIKEAAGTLEFNVKDNGKGFDAMLVRRGNGLENMQKRADEIGAKFLVQSKKDEGCLVSMQLKIT